MPFLYPAAPVRRRHGPQGYSNYESFRPWLRDEFSFRCGYCLVREQWGKVRGVFDLDHFVPVSHDPYREREYDNLVYACAACNSAKHSQNIRAPYEALNANDVQVFEDGRIEARTNAAGEIIEAIGLDSVLNTEFRRDWIRIIALARLHDRELYYRLMCFPDDLPDLSRLRPPGGNVRPEGVEESWFARRERSELVAAY
ncbi:MAG TPA: HNH endonuclease [Pirellulaceae bacterium]|jgi:hypothetical protein